MTTVFGYSWDSIKAAQQGGQLSRPIGNPGMSEPMPLVEADWALWRKHKSIEGLSKAGFDGLVDRIYRLDVKPSFEQALSHYKSQLVKAENLYKEPAVLYLDDQMIAVLDGDGDVALAHHESPTELMDFDPMDWHSVYGNWIGEESMFEFNSLNSAPYQDLISQAHQASYSPAMTM